MKLEAFGQTDVGLKREINQDSILVDKDIGLYIVADGMGGHKGGEIASALAVETVQEFLRNNQTRLATATRDTLTKAYREASARIHRKATNENPELMGMGTTLVCMVAIDSRLFIANVGDSRAYLFREPYLWQLTEDHSLINEQVRAGVISEEDAPFVIARNVITRSVGFERDVIVDILERPVHPGETYMLCSDGLTTMVTDGKIAEILSKNKTKEAVSQCILEAKKGGGEDNISLIAVRVLE